MTNQILEEIENEAETVDAFLQEQFEEVLSEYEIDATMSIEDMLFEMFCLGFESALDEDEE